MSDDPEFLVRQLDRLTERALPEEAISEKAKLWRQLERAADAGDLDDHVMHRCADGILVIAPGGTPCPWCGWVEPDTDKLIEAATKAFDGGPPTIPPDLERQANIDLGVPGGDR